MESATHSFHSFRVIKKYMIKYQSTKHDFGSFATDLT